MSMESNTNKNLIQSRSRKASNQTMASFMSFKQHLQLEAHNCPDERLLHQIHRLLHLHREAPSNDQLKN